MTGSSPSSAKSAPSAPTPRDNRRKVLAAAEELFARCDPSTVTMDAVAAEAGVGKGTLFRRFGDRAGLARAVISEHETELQDAMIRGAPPLGPGAPPLERLIAFGARLPRVPRRATATLLRAAEGSHDAFLHSARLRLLPHARRRCCCARPGWASARTSSPTS